LAVGRRSAIAPRHTWTGCAILVSLLGGCAITPSAELIACLEPNRRVVVEATGTAQPNVPAPKPGAKPSPKTAVKPVEKPAEKPVQVNTVVDGGSAFELDSAVLRDGGKADLDQLLGVIAKRGVRVGSVVLVGHADRYEAERNPNLGEERAKSVASYLAGKGMDKAIMFWEGRGAKEPVPATQFCEERQPRLFF
jgi:outer membrane protein OmpA-like peptidoglycan-associated protein